MAERALEPVIPSVDEFPYTIRLVSGSIESNGSSSQASVCGSPIITRCWSPYYASAGIAMGLIKEEEKTVILADIQGMEDHLDMDFKVAGTRKVLQLFKWISR